MEVSHLTKAKSLSITFRVVRKSFTGMKKAAVMIMYYHGEKAQDLILKTCLVEECLLPENL